MESLDIKRKHVLMHVVTWTNLVNHILSLVRSQLRKTTYYDSISVKYSGEGNLETESRLEFAEGGGGGGSLGW